jgi:hypothetical protein
MVVRINNTTTINSCGTRAYDDAVSTTDVIQRMGWEDEHSCRVYKNL